MVAVGRGLQRGNGFRVEAHALIELGQRDVRAVVLRIEIQDLFEDRDRARFESVLSVLLGDLAVLGDRLFVLAPTAIGVADLEQQLRVA